MSAVERIPLTVMDHADESLFAELLGEVERVAADGAFIGGDAVDRFERAYAEWCEAPHAVGVSSGTDALVLALRALGIGSGDEVIVPANSFIATAEAVSIAGATPRFADVDEETQLLTAASARAAMSGRVRCVIAVHLFGRTVELDPLVEFSREHGLHLLEDAAQAHGARYRGRRVGTIGDAGAFSFYPAKNLGAWGDAGALVTRDTALAEKVRLLRSHGESPRYDHRVVGTTARLDALQAAVLTRKLRHLERWNDARRRIAAQLRAALAASPVTPPPPAAEGCDHVYHQFVVRTRDRDALRASLAREGIATAIHYPVPIHRSRAYRSLVPRGRDLAPVATRLASQIVSLPIHPGLSPRQVQRVAQATAAFAGPSRVQPLGAVSPSPALLAG